MKTVTTSVTPEQAAAWLEQNTLNRPLRASTVEIYANAMRRGEWMLTGEAIKLSGTRLIDGQHRLTACVLAGVPFTTLVIEDIDPDVFSVLDTGMKRTTGDALHIAGIEHGTALSAITNALVTLRTGWSPTKSSRALTRQQVLKFVEINEDRLVAADDRGRQIAVAIGLSRATWSAAMFDLGDQHDGIANHLAPGSVDVHTVDPDAFTNALVTGSDLAEGNPVLALRSWVTRSVVARTKRTAREFASNLSNVLLAIHQGRSLHRVGGHRWARENATWIRTDLDDIPQ